MVEMKTYYVNIDTLKVKRKIKKYMERDGINQNMLAILMNVDPAAVSQWMNKKSSRLPSMERLFALAELFKIDIKELLEPDCHTEEIKENALYLLAYHSPQEFDADDDDSDDDNEVLVRWEFEPDDIEQEMKDYLIKLYEEKE